MSANSEPRPSSGIPYVAHWLATHILSRAIELGVPTIPIPATSPEGELPEAPQALLRRATTEGVSIPSGMLDAFPEDPAFREGYTYGALAAAKRRQTPLLRPPLSPFNQPVNPSRHYIDLSSLPHVTHPIVEGVQQDLPEAVFAADRGGRFVGLSVFWSWRKQYPKYPFPTLDKRVHFGRLSSDQSRSTFDISTGRMLCRSGVWAEMAQRKAEGNRKPVNIFLLDDWTIFGRTTTRFIESLARHGFVEGQDYNLTMATMAGARLNNGIRQIRGLEESHRDSEWNNSSNLIGISDSSAADSKVWRTERAVSSRQQIIRNIHDAYPNSARRARFGRELIDKLL